MYSSLPLVSKHMKIVFSQEVINKCIMKDNGRRLKFNVPAFLEEEELIKFASNGSLIAVLIPLSHYQFLIVIDAFVILSDETYKQLCLQNFVKQLKRCSFEFVNADN